ncbi:MAG: metalloregulator ArsR/SmtB family transcription factor [Vicinamibacteria bacterium]|jgi:ArsR family transcriptional regulator|nr:metalloregulator ArsR/SmtB family transcription factor [Vicinamibacteria bacterium]
MKNRGAQSSRFVAWMDSLADPIRLRLLRLLDSAELGVVDMVDILQLPQSTISRHLKLLAERGWIKSRAEGAANLYALRLQELTPTLRRLWPVVREQTDGWEAVRQDRLRFDRGRVERRRGTEAFFARSAGQWDRLRREQFGHAFGDAALRGLLPRGYCVADLACGTGIVAATLAPHVARVIAVDQSSAMLRAAARRFAGFGNVELRRGALEDLPIKDRVCDAALLILALAYVDDAGRVLREAARIVKPKGRIVVVDVLRHDREEFRRRMGQNHNGFTGEELGRIIGEAGIVVDHCAPLAPEPGAKGPAMLLACGQVVAAAGPRLPVHTSASHKNVSNKKGRVA